MGVTHENSICGRSRNPYPGYDLGYDVVNREPLIVLKPSDHRLTSRESRALQQGKR